MKYFIIGAGISGLAIANLLIENNDEVTIFEKESRPGGMIKCDIVNGSLFHRTGGHVFNSKRQDVLDWFWKHFDTNKEFTQALRNASVYMTDGSSIPYPIENHVYLMNEKIKKSFIEDLVAIAKKGEQHPDNFEDFLRGRFGETLYELYFKPYNYKIWRRNLSNIPLTWLDGKLPMPTVQEMIYNNIARVEERSFVHSSFYYPTKGGSQFLADRFAENLSINFNFEIDQMKRVNSKWVINGEEADRVIFCGNIKQIPSLFNNTLQLSLYEKFIEDLESHGTTTVFCEIEKNQYSWIYMPSEVHEAHRIICTGNFAKSNNINDKLTATIEFTDFIDKSEILDNLSKMPYKPTYISHHYEKYTYPIQSAKTREMISSLKDLTEQNEVFLLGRFAEWEYYNMDAAVGAALDLSKKLFK